MPQRRSLCASAASLESPFLIFKVFSPKGRERHEKFIVVYQVLTTMLPNDNCMVISMRLFLPLTLNRTCANWLFSVLNNAPPFVDLASVMR